MNSLLQLLFTPSVERSIYRSSMAVVRAILMGSTNAPINTAAVLKIADDFYLKF